MQYGIEACGAYAAAVEIDGLIIPDLPEHAFETEYDEFIHQHGLNFIFLVTPQTSPIRIRKLDQLSSGFLYAISSSATTGSLDTNTDIQSYLSPESNEPEKHADGRIWHNIIKKPLKPLFPRPMVLSLVALT